MKLMFLKAVDEEKDYEKKNIRTWRQNRQKKNMNSGKWEVQKCRWRKKNSKKKEKAKVREMPSCRKRRPGFWKVWRKELRKVLAISIVAYHLPVFHSSSYWSSSITRTAARLSSGQDSPLLACSMQFALYPYTVASKISFHLLMFHSKASAPWQSCKPQM